MIELRGIAWDHTRATAPLLVSSGIWAELQGVRVTWDRRSLWAFGEASLEDLVQTYDLLVIDHPLVGDAVSGGLLTPLEPHVEAAWLDDQERSSVGASHRSYLYRGQHWAAAIDAACQVSAARPDLLAARPQTWAEVVALARDGGRVALPLRPIDGFSSFLTLCANQGAATLEVGSGRVAPRDVALRALEQLRELAGLVDPVCFERNPVDTLTRMATTDEIAYVPFSYGYTNFAREGYAPHRLTFGDIPAAGDLGCAGATLGGAGLAVSAHCAHLAEAAAYLQWLAGDECQRTTYVLAGGQPGHRAAWDDEVANRVTGGFFRDTRATIEAAALRPNLPGMHAFQTPASLALRTFLQGGAEAAATLDRMDALFADAVRRD